MQKGFSAVLIIFGVTLGLALFLLSIIAGFWFWKYSGEPVVKNFEDCAKYYPVMESYPAQCNTPDGRHFVQKISQGEESFDLGDYQKSCTLDAKICPDGSSIGRTGPNCEFSQCPSITQKINLPSLYPSVTWQATESAKVWIWDSTKFQEIGQEFDGFRIESDPLNYTSYELMSNFFDYCDQELLKRGWIQNDSAVADGADGGMRGYKTENAYINIRYDGINSGPNRGGTVLVIEYVILE